MKKTGVFFQAQNQSPRQKEKAMRWKEEKIKKESMQTYFLAGFDCLRDSIV